MFQFYDIEKILLIGFCFLESASATVISSIFLQFVCSEIIKGLVQFGNQIVLGLGAGASGIGSGFERAAYGFAMGITGLWTGLYDVGAEIKEASVAIFQVSTLNNIASVVTWAIILMCAPSVAKFVNDLLSKTLPKMFMKLGGDIQQSADAGSGAATTGS